MTRCPRCVNGTMLREYDYDEPRVVCICCGYYEQHLEPLELMGGPEREVLRSDTGKTHRQRSKPRGRAPKSRGVQWGLRCLHTLTVV